MARKKKRDEKEGLLKKTKKLEDQKKRRGKKGKVRESK